LPVIAREFGGRDHTTVLHAYRRASSRIAADRAAFADIEIITALLSDPS
jgi:chromosomal replication initiator protein